MRDCTQAWVHNGVDGAPQVSAVLARPLCAHQAFMLSLCTGRMQVGPARSDASAQARQEEPRSAHRSMGGEHPHAHR
eukprot:15435850-Alexandrium_andersonii.AAC.1